MTAYRQYTNVEVAALLRDVAGALRIRGADRFQSAAYDRAASGVEAHPDSLVRLWEHGRLRNVAGVGGSISQHLDELFRTGRVAYWDEMTHSIPDVVFELLRIPGVGTVTAWKLSQVGVEDLEDLERRLERGSLQAAGFRPKQLEQIAAGLAELMRRPDRMLLPAADALARPLLEALHALPAVARADVLGSVRRRCATAGNINLGVCTEDPARVLAALRGVRSVLSAEERGPQAAALTLHGGQPVDLRMAPPERYGALLLWFTGSAAHVGRVALRAEELGLRLTPDGLVREDSDQLLPALVEDAIYEHLRLPLPPPELREDWGEIDASMLPRLITLSDLRGDCHTHTRWSDGRDTLTEMVEAARALGHEYIVVTDHSYPNMDFRDRAAEFEAVRRRYRDIEIVNGLEVNITVEGGLQVPDEVLALHQFCLASIHTGFRQPREVVTARLLAAIRHPSINGIAHPTGRLLLRCEGVEADWDAVFSACLEHDTFLEIDGPEDRLDLPDELVREAVRRGVKLTVDSDAHATEALVLQRNGIEVARRGWVEPENVLNTRLFAEFAAAANVRT